MTFKMDVNKSIKPIERGVVHRICSGQVVLNLATAVKELVENSLDAQATTIDVRLKLYGSEIIEVSDNGCGVHPDNFQALTLKHHTSKLQDFSDLLTVETFGFRGEALSSLCALSEVTIITRHTTSKYATQLSFNSDGDIMSTKEVARQVGTTVILKNIFYNLPVRKREFQNNLKREFAKMTQLLTAYCLVATNVKIHCVNQTKSESRSTVVSTQGCKTYRENITSVYSTKQLTNLLEWKQDSTGECQFQLEGYISSCAHGAGRATTDRQFYFINSRPCEPTKLTRAVNEVYHQYNAHQSPFVFLNIKLPRNSVDVNVTPDKRQIFVDQENLLIDTVRESLHKMFESIPSTFSMNNVPISLMKKLSPLNTFVKKPTTKEITCDNFVETKQENKTCTTDESANEINSQDFETNCDTQLDASVESENTESKNTKIVTPPETKSQSGCKSLSQWTYNGNFKRSLDDPSGNRKSTKQMKMDSMFPKTTPKILDAKTIKAERTESSSSNSIRNELTSQITESSEPNMTSNLNVTILEKEDKSEKSSGIETSSSKDPSQELSVSEGIDCNSPDLFNSPMSKTRGSRSGSREVNINLDRIRILYERKLKEESRQVEASIRFRALIDPTKNTQAEQELSREISKDMFDKMDVIGQFNLGFIIARLKSDLFIVDQHATDEKPQKLELTAVNECILVENMEVFKANGFEFLIDEEAPVTKRVSLTAVPVSRNWTFGKEDVDELLFMLQDSPNVLCRPSRVRSMFASRACRKSVMIGTALTKTKMKTLLTHMGEIEQPWNCPHGRPTMRHLVNLDLYQ